MHSFTLDFVAHRNNLPDIAEFLKYHGSQLTFIDLNTIPVLDLLGILTVRPMLTSFSSPDWRLPFHADQIDNAAASLLRKPHSHITPGATPSSTRLLPPFHSTGYNAFGSIGLPQAATMLLQRTNDVTFSQLTRAPFPALKVLLTEFERQNGPEGEGYARWERWERQGGAVVRLEDCTGALLTDLALDSEDEW